MSTLHSVVRIRLTVPRTRQHVPTICPDRRLCVVPRCVATQPAGLLCRRFREGLSRQVVGRARWQGAWRDLHLVSNPPENAFHVLHVSSARRIPSSIIASDILRHIAWLSI